jgi:c-di-GMP-binding flagellar brake protein YcgR
MTFGHANFQWEVPTIARAMYDGWWFVDRPDEMDCRRFQRRRFVRIAYKASMLAYPMANGTPLADRPVTLETANFSAGGCLAATEGDLGAQGESLLVFLPIPGQAAVPAVSDVIRIQDDAQGRRKYGIHFRKLEAESQEQVAHFIASEIQRSLLEGTDITFPETGVPA